jgi:phosphoenolpyruvate carboxykinase (ATP)
LNNVEYVVDPIFGVQVPTSCPNVPTEVLTPKNTWSDGDAYDAQARKLAGMFVENFKQFEAEVSDEVKAGAPRLG